MIELPTHADHDKLSYGERAVGLAFNPSGNPLVNDLKRAYAGIIDMLYAARQNTPSSEQHRLYSVAITEAQTAQMWAVKAETWEGR